MAKGTPQPRTFLRWFHAVEDDETRSGSLLNGWNLSQAATNDGLIDGEDLPGFADLCFRLNGEDLLGFDHFGRAFQADLAAEIQQAQNFRSTAKGRQWLGETSGSSFEIHGSQIGQLAGRDITNTNLVQIVDQATAELETLEASDQERREAGEFLKRLREGASGVATGTGAGLAAQALARALGIG